MARPNDDAIVNDDAGSHALSRSQPKTRGRGQQRRGNRGNFLGNALGRGHHGLLGGGLLKHISTLMTLIGLLKGLFKRHKTVGRGGAGQHRKPRKAKIVRARAPRGIRRPAASRQPRSPGATSKRANATFATGVFDVATGRLKRRRLLG
jgi:hypothetical protein